MPANSGALEFARFFQQRNEAQPVNMLLRSRRQTGQFEERGIKIRAENRLGTNPAGPRHAGRAHNQRDTDAAFVEPAFTGAQWNVGSRRAFAGAESAIIRREHDDGAIRQPGTLQGVQHFADCQVHGLDHPGINGVVLHEANLAFAFVAKVQAIVFNLLCLYFVFGLKIGARSQRRVDGVERQVSEKWPFAIRFDELHGFLRETVGKMFALRAIFQPRIFVGRKITGRCSPGAAAFVHIKTLVLRPPAFRSEMPFAGKERSVASGFQRFGQGDFLQRKLVRVRRGQHCRRPRPFFGLRGADVICDAGACGIFAGHDRRASGAANLTGGISIGEAHPGSRKSVEIWRFVKPTALATEIAPAKIIRKNKDEVQLRTLRTR